MQNGRKFGAPEIPFMIANEEDGEFTVPVGSKRCGSYMYDDEYGDSHMKGAHSRAR